MITKVAIVGSHGLYARYGGWEELVKNLAEKKADQIKYLVFNSVEFPPPDLIPPGIEVRQLKFKANGYQGFFYDFWSILLCYRKVDTILLLGVQGMPIIPLIRLFKNVRIVTNVGGFEWLRPKFGFLLKHYLKWCFNLSMTHSDIVILDNPQHRIYLPRKVKADVQVIPYGGEIDHSLDINDDLVRKYPFLTTPYYLSVSRALGDNKLEELCQCFAGTGHKLVLISNYSSSNYGMRVFRKYQGTPNLVLIDGLYYKPELDLIRRNCTAYIHTHTLCGTAPSLVEMIISQRPVLSIDNQQNRYTLNDEGFYYQSFSQILELLDKGGDLSEYIPAKELCDRYQWRKIVAAYELSYSPE